MGGWQEAFREMTPLVVLWLRIHLPMLETRVQSLIWEDPTCVEQLSPFTTIAAREPRVSGSQPEQPPQGEVQYRNERAARMPYNQRKARTAAKTQHSQK